jgi:hypothetical protein
MEQTVINYLFTAVGLLTGWLLKVLWDAIANLRADLRVIERDLPQVYVRKDDMRQEMTVLRSDLRGHFDRIEGTLGAIFDKLDNKADKKGA